MLRLSWSPDGQYIVSAHAMNNSGPTAQIVEREGWKTSMDFVGHRKAITVVVGDFSTVTRFFELHLPKIAKSVTYTRKHNIKWSFKDKIHFHYLST